MSGLFGGGRSSAPAPQQTPVQQAASDANKGATDLEKLKNQKELQRSYGQAMRFLPDSFAGGDTTLASGSLLALGSKLA